MRTAVRLLLLALILYGGACIALYIFQRSLLYFPQPAGVANTAFAMAVDGAELRVAMRAHDGPKALIYFGGNAEDVSASLPQLAAALPDHAIYALHYRGYGGSSGTPTEAALHADALALYDKVRARHADIALVGRSLGSGVAVRLAGLRPVSRLVLVTPYDSIVDIARRQFPWFPVSWLLADRYESWRAAPAIRAPTLLLLQAEHDEVIPAASTARLNAAFTQGIARLVVIPGAGHNTISSAPQYMEEIRKIL